MNKLKKREYLRKNVENTYNNFRKYGNINTKTEGTNRQNKVMRMSETVNNTSHSKNIGK